MKRAFVWRRCVPMALLVAGATLIAWSAGDQAAAAVESDEQMAARKQAVAQIDRRIAEGWARAAIEPSAAADDSGTVIDLMAALQESVRRTQAARAANEATHPEPDAGEA